MALSLLAALGGGSASVGNDWLGNFFSQHSAQSGQSYSAAVARDLGLMNQYFTYNNMTYSKMLQSALNSEAFGYDRSLMELQKVLQDSLNESAFGYDSALAYLSQALNKRSADQDYTRAVNFVRDSLVRYKDALIEAGYNPLLALGSSAAQYSGKTNGVSAGGFSPGSVSGSSVSSGGISGSSPASSSGVGVSSAHALSSSLSSGIHSAMEIAKLSSEIEANEASAQNDSSGAALNLEKAKTEANQRTDSGHKIQSEVAKNYGSIASGIATGIGTAYGARKAAEGVQKAVKYMKSNSGSGNVASKVKQAANVVSREVGNSASSAHVGSRILSSVLPFAAGLTALPVGAGIGWNEARKFADKHPQSNTARFMDLPNYGSRLR